ncbi:abscisic acid receptor PYL11-like [Coffea eugenioides]|uniref:abscisic acid receptor PYL11-like n=1 Tax=Coffea eugenioides TaxID=49369 RepID=UPI000F61249B|nr:abscisic acid receptor PYL11-like [Coffea eugenioides]
MFHNPFPSHQESNQNSKALLKMMNQYHAHDDLFPNQCTSSLVQEIDAPLSLVWSLVRQFDNPQAYKLFIKNCTMTAGDGGIGSVREVMVVSGLPAETSRERLDKLDDDLHVMEFSIIGGDHRLVNYQSTTTLHEDDGGRSDQTVVIESYVVDIPPDSSEMDTCLFADTIVACNLRSLAKISEKMARKVQVPPAA